jgi:hypothetical protein
MWDSKSRNWQRFWVYVKDTIMNWEVRGVRLTSGNLEKVESVLASLGSHDIADWPG